MPQEPQSAQVLDYARPRYHFGVHWPTVIVAVVLVIALNVRPHFMPFGTNVADVPKPVAGWPWVFYFYGQTYGGYGPWWIPERVVYDLVCAVAIPFSAGFSACSIMRRYREQP
jgi:hypothetical protein